MRNIISKSHIFDSLPTLAKPIAFEQPGSSSEELTVLQEIATRGFGKFAHLLTDQIAHDLIGRQVWCLTGSPWLDVSESPLTKQVRKSLLELLTVIGIKKDRINLEFSTQDNPSTKQKVVGFLEEGIVTTGSSDTPVIVFVS